MVNICHLQEELVNTNDAIVAGNITVTSSLSSHLYPTIIDPLHLSDSTVVLFMSFEPSAITTFVIENVARMNLRKFMQDTIFIL